MSLNQKRGVFWPMRFEATVENCIVSSGEIPKDIYGGFYRMGATSRYPQKQGFETMFTTDGMMQGLVLENGRAHFRNRWVRTPKFLAEEQAGRSLFEYSDGHLQDWRRVGQGEIKRDEFTTGVPHGTASISAIPFGREVLAVGEQGCAPVAMNPLTLETEGFPAWTTKLSPGMREPACYGDGTITSHPKWDHNSGELIAWNFRDTAPFATLHWVTPEGAMRSRDLWDAPYGTVLHDGWLTENYLILPFQPFTCSMDRVRKELGVYGWETDLPIILALIRRDDFDGEIRWIDTGLEPEHMLHMASANEVGDTIVMDAPVFDFPALQTIHTANPGDPFIPFFKFASSVMGRWTLDLATGKLVSERVDDTVCELPKIDERFFGKPYENVFLIGGVPSPARKEGMRMDSLIHRNVRTGEQRSFHITDDRHVGVFEAAFIPRTPDAREGDGYVIVPISKFIEHLAEYQIFDTDDITAGPIATIDIPFHSGWNSHGCWLDLRDHRPV